MKAISYVWKRVCLVLLVTFLFLLFAINLIGSARASEREDHQTINNIIVKDHDDLGKGILIGVIATCGLRSLYYGIKDKRWTWCGEPKPEPEFPKPGPVLSKEPVGVKLYQ